jgi:hypothetical protein
MCGKLLESTVKAAISQRRIVIATVEILLRSPVKDLSKDNWTNFKSTFHEPYSFKFIGQIRKL